MASENGSRQSGSSVSLRQAIVLNAGWRLRMVHQGFGDRDPGRLEVLNAGWRLRMVHHVG